MIGYTQNITDHKWLKRQSKKEIDNTKWPKIVYDEKAYTINC